MAMFKEKKFRTILLN